MGRGEREVSGVGYSRSAYAVETSHSSSGVPLSRCSGSTRESASLRSRCSATASLTCCRCKTRRKPVGQSATPGSLEAGSKSLSGTWGESESGGGGEAKGECEGEREGGGEGGDGEGGGEVRGAGGGRRGQRVRVRVGNALRRRIEVHEPPPRCRPPHASAHSVAPGAPQELCTAAVTACAPRVGPACHVI